MDFSDAMCNDGIMLEPRLMEYLNRKKTYRDNDIDSLVSLEKTYSISKDDKRRIARYMKGKRNLYTSNKLNMDSNFVDPSQSKFVTLEGKSKSTNPHFVRLRQKMQKHKDANNSRHNFSGMGDVYQDTPYDFSNDDMYGWPSATRNTINYDNNYSLDMHDDELLDNQYTHNPQKRSSMTYHHEPKVSMNNRLFTRDLGYRKEDKEHSQAIASIIGQFDSYSNGSGNSLYRCAEIDMNNKKFIPNLSSNHKRDNKTIYQAVPYMSGNMRNMDMDNSLQYGVNSRAGKAMGYRNPAEHYYDYIDQDIQHPNHVVNERGLSSRSSNNTTARPYKRDIM